MVLSPAEYQLIRIIRGAAEHDLTVTVRTRGHRLRGSAPRYFIRISCYEDGGPGTGRGCGESFDLAWESIEAQEPERFSTEKYGQH